MPGRSNIRGSKIRGSSHRIGRMLGSKIRIRTVPRRNPRSIPTKSRRQITAGGGDGSGGEMSPYGAGTNYNKTRTESSFSSSSSEAIASEFARIMFAITEVEQLTRRIQIIFGVFDACRLMASKSASFVTIVNLF